MWECEWAEDDFTINSCRMQSSVSQTNELYLASAAPGHVGTSPSECKSVWDGEAGTGFH